MNNKINITSTEMINNDLLLKTESKLDMLAIEPMMQMLVDSDNLSFIYIVDYHGAYTYICIPDSIWPALKSALDANARVFLNIEGGSVLLPNFLEELSYLIENIEGNSNYGQHMVGKVEDIFSNPV